MKLFYYKDPLGNFGDDLNPLIWYSLAPEVFDDDPGSVLVGVGTLLNTRAPALPRKIVMGSGLGYHGFPDLTQQWEFRCVRGPLSAARLGLDASIAITDPAVLLLDVLPLHDLQRGGRICFMPHHASKEFADWRGICAKLGFEYLDPADDPIETIFKIRTARFVIAEAMHAAIVADAYRTPWIPVACYDHILDFKWNDWCQSLGLEYAPERIDNIWDMERHLSRVGLFKNRLKHYLIDRGWDASNWTLPCPITNREQVEDRVLEQLGRLADGSKACLSMDGRLGEARARLLEEVGRLKRDFS